MMVWWRDEGSQVGTLRAASAKCSVRSVACCLLFADAARCVPTAFGFRMNGVRQMQGGGEGNVLISVDYQLNRQSFLIICVTEITHLVRRY